MRVFQVLIKRRIINCTAGKSALKLGNCDALKASEDILLHKVTRFYRLLFGESGGGGEGRGWVGANLVPHTNVCKIRRLGGAEYSLVSTNHVSNLASY